jgi:hypothetical protein
MGSAPLVPPPAAVRQPDQMRESQTHSARSAGVSRIRRNPCVADATAQRARPGADPRLFSGTSPGGCVRVSACKELQRVPGQASTSGVERPRSGAAGPDFPESAAIGIVCRLATNQEVAGSSPAGRANLHKINYIHGSTRGVLPRSTKFEVKPAKFLRSKSLPPPADARVYESEQFHRSEPAAPSMP